MMSVCPSCLCLMVLHIIVCRTVSVQRCSHSSYNAVCRYKFVNGINNLTCASVVQNSALSVLLLLITKSNQCLFSIQTNNNNIHAFVSINTERAGKEIISLI